MLSIEQQMEKYTKKGPGCWEWTGYCRPISHGRLRGKPGKGIVRVNQGGKLKCVAAHRIAYELKFGPVSDDMKVLHKCKNRCCVNPDHLFLEKRNPSLMETFFGFTMKGEGDSCWVWTGSRDEEYGYGIIGRKINGKRKNLRAHVISYEFKNGPIGAGMFVLHRCDHPWCVNPNHLFIGSIKDNVDDMVKKGRQSKGEERPAAKLTEEEIFEIRGKYIRSGPGVASPYSQRGLAREYGVSQHTIQQIVRGSAWKHLLSAS